MNKFFGVVAAVMCCNPAFAQESDTDVYPIHQARACTSVEALVSWYQRLPDSLVEFGESCTHDGEYQRGKPAKTTITKVVGGELLLIRQADILGRNAQSWFRIETVVAITTGDKT